MVEQRKTVRDWAGRFIGPRVNCENVPCLPVKVLTWMLDDPRNVPYLMIWMDQDRERILEAVRVMRFTEMEQDIPWAKCVEIKRADGTKNWVLTIERPLPRNGGKARLVICPRCQHPRRALHPWKLDSSRRHAVYIAGWQCRSCAQLRYASEGGALIFRPRTDVGRLIKAVEGPKKDRPGWWYPYVFVDPRDAAAIQPRRVKILA